MSSCIASIPGALKCGGMYIGIEPWREVDGRELVAMTTQLAGISRMELGAEVGRLGDQRDTIIRALDFLITAI